MGAGKTLVAVMLHEAWEAKRTLVVCPKHVVGVWEREFLLHSFNPPNLYRLTHATQAQKLKAAYRGWLTYSAHPTAFIINYDAVWRGGMGEWIMDRQWDLVICDESHRIKGHKSKVSTFMASLGKKAKKRLCLTGTPLYHSQLDIFGQARFLDPNLFGDSYHRFSLCYAKFFRMPIVTKRGHHTTTRVVCGFQNQEELQEKMKEFVYRPESIDKSKWPEFRHETFTCVLPAKARTLYDTLRTELVAEISSGVVTALNGLKATMRLRQLVSGYLRADGELVLEIIHTAKADLLASVLTDIDSPVVVFAEFRHDLSEIRRIAKKLELRYGEVSGRASDLGPGSTYPEKIDVLGVQYQSGGSGVDFQNRCHRAIYYSPTWRLGDYKQSLRRIYRAGQKHNVVFTHLVCERTVDVVVTKALEKRGKIVDAVIDSLREEKG